jgi:hypothetical protein
MTNITITAKRLPIFDDPGVEGVYGHLYFEAKTLKMVA